MVNFISTFFHWGKEEKVEKIIEESEEKAPLKDDSITVDSSKLSDGSTTERYSKSRRESTKVNISKRVVKNDDA